MMFTKPTIVTSDDLSKRSYVTFYFKSKRIREYNANSIGLRINPNRATSVSQRNELLELLQFELRKALENNKYPSNEVEVDTIDNVIDSNASTVSKQLSSTQYLLDAALNHKMNADLSRTYKRDLASIHHQFVSFLEPSELQNAITAISAHRINTFLSQYGSSGTYYMNKRRNLSILFAVAGRIIDQPIKIVKETERRRSKAKLHKAYDKKQLKPILNYLKIHYPNLYVCCLLTYGSWLRPHEEIRLLTAKHFKNDYSEIHLSGDENKGLKVRVVYVPEYVRKEIEPILIALNRNSNLFSLQVQPFNESYFNTQWSRAWQKMFKLGLIHENQTIYSFRHTAAIDLYRRTKDVYLLQKLLGHSTIVVTLKYLRNLGELDTSELKDAAPTLDF